MREWFDSYLEAFGALARGEPGAAARMPAFFDLPLLITSSDGVLSLESAADVAGWIDRQAEATRAAGYDHTAVLAFDHEPLNATTTLIRTDLSRRRADGAELQRLSVVYVVTLRGDNPRAAALLLVG